MAIFPYWLATEFQGLLVCNPQSWGSKCARSCPDFCTGSGDPLQQAPYILIHLHSCMECDSLISSMYTFTILSFNFTRPSTPFWLWFDLLNFILNYYLCGCTRTHRGLQAEVRGQCSQLAFSLVSLGVELRGEVRKQAPLPWQLLLEETESHSTGRCLTCRVVGFLELSRDFSSSEEWIPVKGPAAFNTYLLMALCGSLHSKELQCNSRHVLVFFCLILSQFTM